MVTSIKRYSLAIVLACMLLPAMVPMTATAQLYENIRPTPGMIGSDDDLQQTPLQQSQAALDTSSNDPLEWLNRPVFVFNSVIDYYLLEPVAKGYRYITPKPVRTGIRNVIRNLQEPVNAMNSLLQGDIKHTGDSLLRFMVNSGFGLGGIIDIAGMHDINFRDEDFGQTMAIWGVPSGPYLVFPFLGPSSPRQMAGRAIDGIAFDPFQYIAEEYSEVEGAYWILRVLNLVDIRARNIENVEALRASAQDPYVVVRSIYWQQRALDINNGQPPAALDNAFADAFAE